MIEATPKVVENIAAPSWTFYLRGLWASGLRLSESMTLRWDDAPGAIVVDLSGRRPMLRIPAEAEKGNRDRLLPMTPEFATLLAGVPERERRGRVFKLGVLIDGQLIQVKEKGLAFAAAYMGAKRRDGSPIRKVPSWDSKRSTRRMFDDAGLPDELRSSA